MTPPKPTPWSAWLKAAAAASVTPAAFWRLSVCEWRALIGSAPAGAMTRAEFEALQGRFTDRFEETFHDPI